MATEEQIYLKCKKFSALPLKQPSRKKAFYQVSVLNIENYAYVQRA